jgi:hypothetical protein
MFLQTKDRGVLVEVMDVTELIDPLKPHIHGRVQAGQEEQDPEEFAKGDLVFPSGETLPRCWQDADYQTNK